MKNILRAVRAMHEAEMVPAVNVLDLAGVQPVDGDTVTLGGRVYELDDQFAPHVAAGRVRVPVFAGYANGTLHVDDDAVPDDGDTVTIGSKTYTFKTALTNVDGYVKIGDTIIRSAYNLVAAINVGNGLPSDEPQSYGALNDAGEGPGVAYAAAMTANPAKVAAGYGGDYDIGVFHYPGGYAGTSIATVASNLQMRWDAATLGDVDQVNLAAYVAALTAAINNDEAGLVWARAIDASIVVMARKPGNLAIGCSEVIADAAGAWQEAATHGGRPAPDILGPVAVVARTVTAAEERTGVLVAAFGFEPRGAMVQMQNAAGFGVAFTGQLGLVGNLVTISSAEGFLLDAGQVVSILAFR